MYIYRIMIWENPLWEVLVANKTQRVREKAKNIRGWGQGKKKSGQW